MRRGTILLAALVLTWVGIVFYFSSQPYQDQTIIPLLKELFSKEILLQWLPDVTIHYDQLRYNARTQPYHFVELLVRKAAHLLLYCALAFIAYMAQFRYREGKLGKAAIALLLTVLVAALDELNQKVSLLRNGSFYDVGLDAVGGCFGLMLAMILCSRLNRKKRNVLDPNNHLGKDG